MTRVFDDLLFTEGVEFIEMKVSPMLLKHMIASLEADCMELSIRMMDMNAGELEATCMDFQSRDETLMPFVSLIYLMATGIDQGWLDKQEGSRMILIWTEHVRMITDALERLKVGGLLYTQDLSMNSSIDA